MEIGKFYVYIYLDPRRPGIYKYGKKDKDVNIVIRRN